MTPPVRGPLDAVMRAATAHVDAIALGGIGRSRMLRVAAEPPGGAYARHEADRRRNCRGRRRWSGNPWHRRGCRKRKSSPCCRSAGAARRSPGPRPATLAIKAAKAASTIAVSPQSASPAHHQRLGRSPIALPSGQSSPSELQIEPVASDRERIALDVRQSEKQFVAAPAANIVQRHAQRRRSLIGAHAEIERGAKRQAGCASVGGGRPSRPASMSPVVTKPTLRCRVTRPKRFGIAQVRLMSGLCPRC